MKKRNYLLVSIILVLIALLFSLFLPLKHAAKEVSSTTQLTSSPVSQVIYPGKNGKTAQDLLIASTKGKVTFDQSGMVSGINNRVADPQKHEYWAFYVNGKMSNVGASSYVTKDTDKIEWKIEKY